MDLELALKAQTTNTIPGKKNRETNKQTKKKVVMYYLYFTLGLVSLPIANNAMIESEGRGPTAVFILL